MTKKQLKIIQFEIQNFKNLQLVNSNITPFNKILKNEVFYQKNNFGKTSILEAICFLFTKKNLKNKQFNFVSNYLPNYKKVSINLILGDVELGFSKLKLETSYLYKNLKNKDNYDYNQKTFYKLLEQELKISCDLLIYLISPAAFFELTPGEALKTIVNLLSNKNADPNCFGTILEQIKKSRFKIRELEMVNQIIKSYVNPYLVKHPVIFNEIKNGVCEINQQQLDILKQNVRKLELDKFNFIKKVNAEIQLHKFSFQFNLVSEDETEGLTLIFQNVNFKDLNTAQRLLLAIELSKYFQLKNNLMLPILIDNIEVLDKFNLKDLIEKSEHQLLMVGVKNNE